MHFMSKSLDTGSTDKIVSVKGNFHWKEMEIHHLNDDVMKVIFAYVCAVDKLKFEIVNKRWSHLLKESWTAIKYLEVADFISCI